MRIEHNGISVYLVLGFHGDKREWIVLTKPDSDQWIPLYYFDPAIDSSSSRDEAIEAVKARLIGEPPPTGHATSSAYCCGKCEARGVRLWRDYQTFLERQTLTCATCIESERVEKVDPDNCDQIGWRVAAVPTPSGKSYWGYTSGPMAAVAWWRALPMREVQ